MTTCVSYSELMRRSQKQDEILITSVSFAVCTVRSLWEAPRECGPCNWQVEELQDAGDGLLDGLDLLLWM